MILGEPAANKQWRHHGKSLRSQLQGIHTCSFILYI